MRTIVVHHSADFDGLFSGAVCKHFLPDAELIGWDFGDIAVAWDSEPDDRVFVVDLPPTAVTNPFSRNMVWIDHHKSSIRAFDDACLSCGGTGNALLGGDCVDCAGTGARNTELHPKIPGLRIDGVAACRLCWSYFNDPDREQMRGGGLSAEYFQKRLVPEPLALTLAGEYDVWDLHDPDAQAFQFGLLTFSRDPVELDMHLLRGISDPGVTLALTKQLCEDGHAAMRWQKAFASDVQKERAYRRTWEGVDFCVLASVHARNSMWFPEEGWFGANALMSWRYDGNRVSFSLYHAPGHEDIDLSVIAAKYGGGGHRGAAGFSLPLDEALEIIR